MEVTIKLSAIDFADPTKRELLTALMGLTGARTSAAPTPAPVAEVTADENSPVAPEPEPAPAPVAEVTADENSPVAPEPEPEKIDAKALTAAFLAWARENGGKPAAVALVEEVTAGKFSSWAAVVAQSPEHLPAFAKALRERGVEV